MNTGKMDPEEFTPVPPEEFDLLRDLQTEAQTQKSKTEEYLKKREREWGKQTSDCMRQNHEGGVLESFGAAARKLVFEVPPWKTSTLSVGVRDSFGARCCPSTVCEVPLWGDFLVGSAQAE
jgi:sugar-specific transcriptional regulator TrmB